MIRSPCPPDRALPCGHGKPDHARTRWVRRGETHPNFPVMLEAVRSEGAASAGVDPAHGRTVFCVGGARQNAEARLLGAKFSNRKLTIFANRRTVCLLYSINTNCASTFGMTFSKTRSFRMRRLPALGLLASLFGAICVPSIAAQSEVQKSPTNVAIPGESRPPLDSDALRTLLSNAYVTPARPADVIMDHPPGEIFRADGDYVRIPNRTRQYGTFDIQGNLVCVQGADFPRLCRQVISHRDGIYSFVNPSNVSTMLATITPHH